MTPLDEYRPALLGLCLERRSIREVLNSVRGPEALIRPALFHLMWTQELMTDLSVVLSENSEVWASEVAA